MTKPRTNLARYEESDVDLLVIMEDVVDVRPAAAVIPNDALEHERHANKA